MSPRCADGEHEAWTGAGGIPDLLVPTVVDDWSLVVEHWAAHQGHDVLASTAVWVGHLRRIGAQKLSACGLSSLVDDAQVLISELLTNGFRHGAGHQVVFRLVITTDMVVIEVDDGSPGRPEVHEAGADEESGRGMFLVNALADSWGVSEDGTRTWCVLAAPASTRSSRSPRCRRRVVAPP